MRGIRIANLYGHFDYNIIFSEEGMTILTGPNGFGKSTILRIIYALANSDLDYFFELSFSEIEILMDDPAQNFLMEKEQDYLHIHEHRLRRQDFMEWKKSSIQQNEADIESFTRSIIITGISGIVIQMQMVAGHVFLIEEQRLVKSEIRRSVNHVNGNRNYEHRIVQAVRGIPEQLQERMEQAAGAYSNISNELDSTFPQRLFAQKEGISNQDFNTALASMQTKVRKLKEYGISNIGKLDDMQFKENDARALKVYFSDFEKKYLQYEKLIDYLDLFKDIVNSRFLFKQMQISAEKGVSIFDDHGSEIPLSKLSSGEKETLILFYKLIFEVPENSMLLIDEPEMSLHIAWQRKFAEDLKTIVDRKAIKAVIATHSVQIINGNRRIQRDLGQLYEKNGFD
ncbi:MAG: AAA family ATPase [Eubacterium sp.]|nr:AAA family ATPase [Eubacterium sp.]